MKSYRPAFSVFITALILFTACGDRSKAILNKKDFDNGQWLLVVRNEVEKTIFVVDDEKTLAGNPYGLLLGYFADCGGTTCDGFIELYQNGELVAAQEYLSRADLEEDQSLSAAYRVAKENWIYPDDEKDFNRQWDSLLKLPHTYPVRSHTQPDDKDVIHCYVYE